MEKKRSEYVPFLFAKRQYIYENQGGVNKKPYLIMIHEDKGKNGPDLCATPVKRK